MKGLIKYISICCFAASIVSCGGTRTQTEVSGLQNHLVQNTVKIGYEYDMYVPEEYWFFKGLDNTNFIQDLYKKTREGNLNIFYPLTNETYPKDEVKMFFSDNKSVTNRIPKEDIKHLVFNEEWFLDTSKFVMKKNVLDYSLVRVQLKETDTDTSELVKSLVASYRFNNTASSKNRELTPLAKNLAYEVSLTNPIIEEWLDYISVKHVVQVIIDKITSGTVPVYSFMVKDTLIELPIEDVKERLGEHTYSIEFYNEETGEEELIEQTTPIDYSEITGIVFIEDWYIDQSTMKIHKKVKGIAPVREYAKVLDQDDYELVRTIPCVVYFKE